VPSTVPLRPPIDDVAGGDDPDPRRAPASLTQRSSLLMSAFNPSREFMSWVYQLNGKLDVDALAFAVDDVVRRHDMLRVRFEDRGAGPEQVVTPFRPGVLEIVRLDDRPKAQGLAAAVKAIETDYRDLSPWDDARLRATLYLVAPKTNVLAVFVAEALVDGDSGTLVAAEISRAYAAHAGRPATDLPLPSDESYLRYVLEHPVPPAVEERAEQYWRRMTGVPATAGEWPTEMGERSTVIYFKVHREGWERLVRGTPALGMIPYVVVLSWLEMALARVAKAEHFYVTSAVANRRHPKSKGMIGSFVGPVRLPAEVYPEDRLEDVSRRVMKAHQLATVHSVVPVPLAEARAVAPAPYVPPPPCIGFFMFDERVGLDLPGVRQRRFRVHTGNRDILRVNCTPDDEGGRNFFFISASAPRALLDELVAVFRGLMEEGSAPATAE
jgi:hypothetical protein